MGKKRPSKKSKKPVSTIVWILLGLFLIGIMALGYLIKEGFIGKPYVVHRESPPPKIRQSLSLGVPLPRGYDVFGIDVSRHQGRINWSEVTSFRFDGKKFEFVFIKATEGSTWQDPEFSYNWRKAKSYGILRGAYHFYQPRVNSKKQMRNFTAKVKMSRGDLPPVLDVEIESSLPRSTYRAGVLNCLRIMEQTYGVIPIVYTNQKLYREYFNHPDFRRYPFWISRLRSTKPRTRWHFWQFTYEAVIPGTNEYVDVNVFNGSKQQLLNMTKK